jgi:hypothetical protein
VTAAGEYAPALGVAAACGMCLRTTKCGKAVAKFADRLAEPALNVLNQVPGPVGTGIAAATGAALAAGAFYYRDRLTDHVEETPYGYDNGPLSWNYHSGVVDKRVADALIKTEGRYIGRHHMLINNKIEEACLRHGYTREWALSHAKQYSRFVLERESSELKYYDVGDTRSRGRKVIRRVKIALAVAAFAATLHNRKQITAAIKHGVGRLSAYVQPLISKLEKLATTSRFQDSLNSRVYTVARRAHSPSHTRDALKSAAKLETEWWHPVACLAVMACIFAIPENRLSTKPRNNAIFQKVVHTKCAFRPVPQPKLKEDWGYRILQQNSCAGRRAVQVCGPIVQPDDLIIPHHCNDAAMRALLHRQMKYNEPHDDAFTKFMIDIFKREYLPMIFPKHSVEVMTEKKWLYDNEWPKSKRDMNVRAMAENDDNLEKRHYCKDSFIKEEVAIENPFKAKPYRERFIQGNTSQYNVCIAPAIKSCANAMKKTWDGSGVIHYACRSNTAMGRIVYDNMCDGLFYFAESDFAAFDSHQHLDLLRMEAEVYDYMLIPFPGKAQVIEKIKRQEKTHGHVSARQTEGCIEYWGKGTRASGMPNTSCGNTILNVFAQLSVLTLGSSVDQVKRWIRGRNFALHLLGDDMWFQGEKPCLDAMKAGWEAFKRVGLPATGAIHDEDIYKSEFLRRRPYDGIDAEGRGTIVMMPRPGRILQRAFVRYAGRVLNRHDTAYYAHVVATGLRQQFVNTPVITKLLDRILLIAGAIVDEEAQLRPIGKIRRAQASINRHLQKRIQYWGSLDRLTDEGIDQFCMNYNLSKSDILEAEAEIEQMTSLEVVLRSPAFARFHEVDNYGHE